MICSCLQANAKTAFTFVPVNDLCANAIELIPGTGCSYTPGTFNGAAKDGGDVVCATYATQDFWYKFTATDATMSVSLDYSSASNQALQIMQGGCGGAVIACVNAFGMNQGESYFGTNFIPGQEYYIRVINAGGFNSTSAIGICVTKYPAPANDLCANATQLTPGTSCSYIQGTFSGSIKDGGTPSCATDASQDVWYKFIATDVTMSISLDSSSNLNHGFEIYQGGCNGTLLNCINAYAAGSGESYFNNNFIVGQEYYIRVINAVSSVSIRNFSICVTKYPTPANDLCSNAQQLTPGTSCSYTLGTFSGSLKDGNIPSCATDASQDVWYKFTATDAVMSIGLDSASNLNHGFEIYQGGCNGTLISCVNGYGSGLGESYVNNNFIVGQEYYIRVINASGSLSVRNFSICVTKYPTPPNDLCANATEVFPGTTCTYVAGTFSGAMNDGVVAVCPTASATQDIWYKFIATDQTYSIYLNPVSGFNPGFQIFEGSCSGDAIACVNNFGNNTSEYYISNSFVVGQTYYVRFFHAMNGFASNNISFCITKYPRPVNDTCENATLLQQNATCQQVGATFSGATYNGPALSCAPQAGQDVWFRFIAEGPSANVYIGPVSGRDLGFQVFQGGCSGTSLTCINSTGLNISESGTVNNLTQGQEYIIRVFNVYQGLMTENFTICVSGTIQPCTASVSITSSASEICQVSNVTFTATPVNGGTVPQYQWKKNGNITGTNNPVYTAGDLVDGDEISVVMTSSAACPSTPTVTSNSITMNVITPVAPAFSQVAAICPGETFVLPATSANEITGTWSPAINTAATTTYTFTPDAGQCATSQTMTVTVNNINPAVTASGAVLTASVQGAAYQWINCADNQPIPSATSQSYTAVQNGNYAVIVSQSGCSSTSDCVTVSNLVVESYVKSVWKIYPNPATELLNIDTVDSTDVVITDVTGKTILSATLRSGSNIIDMKNLSSGMYFIRSSDGGTVKVIQK